MSRPEQEFQHARAQPIWTLFSRAPNRIAI